MWRFHLKMIKRQWQSGAIRLLCAAIAIASAAVCSVSMVSGRLDKLFMHQSKEVLAADMVLKSSTPLRDEQRRAIADSDLMQAEILIFRTMASAGDGHPLLSSVKAVSATYPLRGKLQVSERLFGEARDITHGPAPGEAWVDERVLHELGIALGDRLTIGELELVLTRILVYEPDRGGNFYSLIPRVMIHRKDVEAAGVVRTGSRMKYRYLFAGEPEALQALRIRLQGTLGLNQRFVDIREENKTLASNLDRAFSFLRISTFIAVLLGAIATALASYQYAREKMAEYAVLRCLGLYGRHLYLAIMLPFVLYALLSTVVGIGVGTVVHHLILVSLTQLLPENLPASGPLPFVLSLMTVLTVLLTFAWPFLGRLRHARYQELMGRARVGSLVSIQTGIALAFGLVVLAQVATADFFISGVVMTTLVLLGGGMYLGLQWLLRKLVVWGRSVRHLNLRLSLRMLCANRNLVGLQMTAMALGMFALTLVYTLRDDLLRSWQSKIPENASNFFAINLFPEDRERFMRTLRENGIVHSPLYPIVRGRLSGINEIPVRDYVNRGLGRHHEGLDRDLSLTWGTELPFENAIVEGEWHGTGRFASDPVVSVEQEVAEKLNIDVGDMLEFAIDTQRVQARVASIRSCEWESFTPNFYMIFSPGALDHLPYTWMASMHVRPAQRVELPVLTRGFPGVTFFDVDFLLSRIRGISMQVSSAVELVLLFSIIASIMVFLSIELILHRDRRLSTAIFKALGAGTRQVQKVFWIQLLFSGTVAGLVALLMNLLLGMILSRWYIEGELVFNAMVWFFCLVLTPLMGLSAGYVSIRRFGQVPGRLLLQGE